MPIDNLTPDDIAKVILEGGGISSVPPAKGYIVTFKRGTKIPVTELVDMGAWFYAGLGPRGQYIRNHWRAAKKAGFFLARLAS